MGVTRLGTGCQLPLNRPGLCVMGPHNPCTSEHLRMAVVPYLDNRGLASALVVAAPVLLAPPSAPAATPAAVVVVVPPSVATRGRPAFSSPTLAASPRFLTGVRLPCHTSFHLHD
jgi:hypothetical protein